MPAGATPVDFAFRIHTDVGSHVVGAKVNGKMVPLSYKFKNGDVAEIISRSDGHPSRDWLAFTKTAHARSKIKAYFKKLSHAENIVLGREAIQREADRLGVDSHLILKDEALKAIAPGFNVPNEEELLAAVGYGTISATSVINRIQPGQTLAPKGLTVGRGRADDSKLKVTAGTVDNVLFRRARCCLPIPGDEVIGYVTRGKGMALHRRECLNVKHYEKTEPERLIAVDYTGGDSQVYSVNLIIETADRTGLLADIGTVFGEQKTFITAIKTQSHRDRTATLEVAAEVKDVDHLTRLFQAVQRLPDVLDISRAIGGREK
jgi:Guanosine polyphosphate pyrophosphohydrolases/synthetases